MKKIVYLSLILLLLVGCNKKVSKDIEIKNQDNQEEILENNVINEDSKKDNYIDDNPVKISFYKKNNGVYKRLDKFESKVESMKEIGIFSIILSDEEEVYGNSIKNLLKEKMESNPEFSNYKIGFNIKFTLKDGTVISENILKPLNYGSYGFSPYLYAWLYDDINTSGWHSHIEENEFRSDTIMSSIKLMWGPSSSEINGNIELSVFTYDEDDFDDSGNYRGVSKFTTIIERS